MCEIGKLPAGVAAVTVAAFGVAYGQQGPRSKSSYMEVEINEPFSETFARLSCGGLTVRSPLSAVGRMGDQR